MRAGLLNKEIFDSILQFQKRRKGLRKPVLESNELGIQRLRVFFFFNNKQDSA